MLRSLYPLALTAIIIGTSCLAGCEEESTAPYHYDWIQMEVDGDPWNAITVDIIDNPDYWITHFRGNSVIRGVPAEVNLVCRNIETGEYIVGDDRHVMMSYFEGSGNDRREFQATSGSMRIHFTADEFTAIGTFSFEATEVFPDGTTGSESRTITNGEYEIWVYEE